MSEWHKATIGRRQLLRTGMFGIVATATSALLDSDDAVADTETNDVKRKARYRAHSAEVQTFYRVNRYPKR